MKLKKIITMGLAAIMAVSAMSISAFAAEEDILLGKDYEASDNISNIEELDENSNVVFLIADDEIKQITPISSDASECSAVIEDNNILIISQSGEVMEEIPITADIEDSTYSFPSLGVACRVKYNGTRFLDAPMAGANCDFTLSAGDTFWRNSYSGLYSYGCVKVSGTNTYRYGYVLTSSLE